MEIFQIALVIVIAYIAVFMLLDRVCKCCEMCAMYKAYGKAVDMDKVKNVMKQENK